MTREQFQQIYQQGPEACFQLFQALAQRVAALEDKLAPGPHTPSSAQGFIKPKNQRPKKEPKAKDGSPYRRAEGT